MSNIITAPGDDNYSSHAARIFNHQQTYRKMLQNGSLRKDDFRFIQEEVTRVRKNTLNGFQDLMNSGLTFPTSLDKQIVVRENLNDFSAANVEMNPTKTDSDNTNYELDFSPLPIIHKGWNVPWRQTGYSYKEASGMELSVRRVAESIENLLFNGDTTINVKYAGSILPIYGYTTHPSSETFTISDWASTDGNGDYDELTSIVPEVIGMRAQLFNKSSVEGNSELCLYVSNNYWGLLDNDYKAETGGSIKDRLMQISNIVKIKPADKLDDDTVVLVELNRRTVEMGIAQDIITVPHNKEQLMQGDNFTTYACMTPFIHADRNDKTGIIVGTTS